MENVGIGRQGAMLVCRSKKGKQRMRNKFFELLGFGGHKPKGVDDVVFNRLSFDETGLFDTVFNWVLTRPYVTPGHDSEYRDLELTLPVGKSITEFVNEFLAKEQELQYSKQHKQEKTIAGWGYDCRISFFDGEVLEVAMLLTSPGNIRGGKLLVQVVGDVYHTQRFIERLYAIGALDYRGISLVNYDKNRGGFAVTENQLERSQLGLPEFYPFLPESGLDEFITGFFESNSAVLLLVGPPGTGKSSFMRSMTGHAGSKKSAVIYGNSAKPENDFIQWFYNSGFDTLYIEDSDQLLSKREDGNSAMGDLLNGTNGIITNHKKLVISTNLDSIGKIDRALLRAGRLYAAVKFRALTVAESERVYDTLNFAERRELVSGHTYTLAELLSPAVIVEDDSITDSSFGFVKKKEKE